MNDLKVGDIVRWHQHPPDPRRGVITKLETPERIGVDLAVVFWFGSRERLAVNVDYLVKVEERGT